MITVRELRAALDGLDDDEELLTATEATKVLSCCRQGLRFSTMAPVVLRLGRARTLALWRASEVRDLALTRRTQRGPRRRPWRRS